MNTLRVNGFESNIVNTSSNKWAVYGQLNDNQTKTFASIKLGCARRLAFS